MGKNFQENTKNLEKISNSTKRPATRNKALRKLRREVIKKVELVYNSYIKDYLPKNEPVKKDAKGREIYAIELDLPKSHWNYNKTLEIALDRYYQVNKPIPKQESTPKVFVPKGFIENVLWKLFPSTATDLSLRDEVLTLLGMIYNRTMFRSHKDYQTSKAQERNFDRYVAPIHSAILRKICSNNDSRKKFIISRLTEGRTYVDGVKTIHINPVINIDHSYQVGKRAKGFQFADEIFKGKFERVSLKTNRVAKKYNEILASNREQFWVMERIAFKNEVYKYLNELEKEAQTPEDLVKVRHYQYAVEAIQNGVYFLGRDKTGNRVHHNLTNLLSDLRHFLYDTITRQNMVSVDIKNSQPLLLSAFLAKEGNERLEFETFRQHCEQGVVYDKMMESMDWKGDRKSFKQLFFAEVFFSEIGKKFKKAYPELFDFLYRYKRKHGKKGLPVALQQLEASLVVDKACRDLHRNCRKRKNGITALTIHDSILVPEKDVEKTKKILAQTFEKEINMTPILNVEHNELSLFELVARRVKKSFTKVVKKVTDLLDEIGKGIADLTFQSQQDYEKMKYKNQFKDYVPILKRYSWEI